MAEVVTPSSVLANHDHEGFCPADAALVASNGQLQSALFSQKAIHDNGRDNLKETLEAKFQLERSVKESQLAVEKSVTQSVRDIAEARRELAATVTLEAIRTRELIMQMDASNKAQASSMAQFTAILEAVKSIGGTSPLKP